jgi:ech hydrogenase subunit A
MINTELLFFLIIFPSLIALLLVKLKNVRVRELIVFIGAGFIILASIWLLLTGFSDSVRIFSGGGVEIALLMFAAEIAMSLYILYISAKYRKYATIVIALIQLCLLAIMELIAIREHSITENLFIDQFSVIMAVIIGIIGSLICIYAVGYIREYHIIHSDIPDRTPFFFFAMFLFLSSMFGLVFSNNLLWVFFFWEITTLCSFLLIGYSGTEEAINNAFWALFINIAGGIAFTIGILYILITSPSDQLLFTSLIHAGPLALIPAALISIAGLTKSAQMPFSSWLVGAMVAPTPVSALLHSSTMVKAGVYVIVRFAPVFEGELIGILIAFIGGITFLIASCIAVNMSKTKKILAYSTIANLGLVVACAGVGTPDAVWAAILLIIFHAIAKSLLFISVGSVSHRIGSLDLEDMAGLITTMPRVAVMMLIGIAGMFLAPFGMLISKWASLHAFVQVAPPFGIFLVLILAYGSAVTAFFWTKWMGKLIQATYGHKNLEEDVTKSEWVALYTITSLTLFVCILFPFISWYMIEPYLSGYYQSVSHLISLSNVEIMIMMLFLILMMPFSLSYFMKGEKRIPRYMGGLLSTDGQTYTGSLGTPSHISLSNYYLDPYFGEKRIFQYGIYLSGILLVILIIMIHGGG